MRKPRIHYLEQYLVNPYEDIKVFVIGAGGTGSHVMLGLARIHHTMLALGRPKGLEVTCIDPKLVAEHNVGRQGFYDPDVGLPKALVMTSRLNRSYGLNWHSRVEKFTKQYEHNANIIISCVDDVKSRKVIDGHIKHLEKKNRHYQTQNKLSYWMDFGNTRDTGQVVLGTCGKVNQPSSKKYKPVDKLPTVIDVYPDMAKNDNFALQGDSCSLITSLEEQDLFVNSILAELGMKMLWELLKYYNTNYRGFYYNGNKMQIAKIPIE